MPNAGPEADHAMYLEEMLIVGYMAIDSFVSVS
jgi:hypothetical protein